MILVRVREHDAGKVSPLLLEETNVGEDEIDAGQVVAGEGDAEIHRHPGAPALVAEAVDGEIHPDLADAAERRKDEFSRRCHHGLSAAGRTASATTSPAATTLRDPSGKCRTRRPFSSRPSKRPTRSRPSR